jgi:hypothetical protein
LLKSDIIKGTLLKIKIMKIKITKKLIVISATALAVAVVGVLFTIRANHQASQVVLAPDNTDGINYEPATEEEKQQAEDNKDKLTDRINQESQQPTGSKRQVNVQITSAEQTGSGEIEIYAYVSGVTENGGTCTALFTKDGEKVAKTSVGVQDATTTLCTPIRFPKTELPSTGNWSIVMGYTSSVAEGSSSPSEIKVN